MKRKSYRRCEGGWNENGSTTFVIVKGELELSKLKKALRWKRLKAQNNVFQGEKYMVYLLANAEGKRTGYYKVVKQGGILKEDEVRYYKRKG